jgi:hypothetical protein
MTHCQEPSPIALPRPRTPETETSTGCAYCTPDKKDTEHTKWGGQVSPTPWNLPDTPTRWLSSDEDEGNMPLPSDTPNKLWKQGPTALDATDEALLAMVQEILDHVEKDPRANLVQGLARCAKLIGDIYYRFGRDRRLLDRLLIVHADLIKQSHLIFDSGANPIPTSTK